MIIKNQTIKLRKIIKPIFAWIRGGMNFDHGLANVVFGELSIGI